MVLLLILVGVFLPLFALTAWFHKRLRDALAERHPGTLHAIDSMTRTLPRGQRSVDRRGRYKMLHDPEIDRHIRNSDRAQYLLQYAVLAFFPLVIILSAVSAWHR